MRTPGSLQTFVDTFGVASPDTPHVLRVKNGDRHRQQRLSGVRVSVGGELQFCGADIGLDTPLCERLIYPGQRDNEISIELTGAEAGQITIDIRPHVGTGPVASAGADRVVPVGGVVQLDASGSRSTTSSTPQIAWELVAAPLGSTAFVSPTNSTLASFVADLPGFYVARVVVSAGGLSTTDSVTIHALGGGNLPPVASAGLNVSMEVGESIQLDGSGSFDPEGQPLDYAWTLGSGPVGHNGQLLNTTSVAPTFTPDLPGFYVISLVVNDGQLDSVPPDRTRITVSPFNAAPVANAGPDQNVPVGATVQLDGAGSFDPEGQPLGYSWSLSSVPPGSNAALSDPFLVNPTFVADVAGGYTARLIVSDGLKFSQPDEVLVTATSSQVSVPNVVGLTQSAAQDVLRAAGLEVGVLAAVPSAAVASGSVAGQAPLAGALVAPATPVDLDISIGGGVDIVPPTVGVSAAPSIVDVGQPVQISVSAADNVGLVNVTLEVNGVAVALDAANQASYTPTTSGLFKPRATATDAAGLASSATTTFLARAVTNNGPPSVALTSPVEDATIRSVVSVLGTASDADLAQYELQLAPAASGQFVTFVTGSSSVVGGQLGRLAPGSFAPGVYDLRVCARDTWGNSACSANVRIELDAVKRAPGLVSFAFLDGFVDVVGLPISVRRVYDGASKTVGDFGVGWRLDTDSVKLETTREMGADWRIQKVGTIFPTYFLNPAKDHRVNVFLPDGTAHRFRMRPDPSSQQLFPIDILNGASFDALAGTTSTLTPNDQPCFVLPVLNSSGPVQIFNCSLELYNPTGYTLNLVDGRRLTFVQDSSTLQYRLATLRDANGNTLTFGANGISHSAGAGVSWVRDGQGRITSITNPEGAIRTYVYDPRGDLVEATDFAGVTTQFVYDDAHNLIRVIDPRGFTPGTLIYNEAGQIVAMIDPDGNRVEISYDNTANQQIVTDRLGHTTVSTYDAAGNLISVLDPLGHETTATYDAEGRLLSRTDPLGHTQVYTYDADGRLLTHTDAMGHVTSRVYDSAGRMTSISDALGHTTSGTYDASGNLSQVTLPGGSGYQFQYGSNGAVSQVTRPDGGVLVVANNSTGVPTSFTDPLGRIRTVDYRADGQLESLDFDFNGQPARYGYAYDGAGRITQAQLPDGSAGTIEYDVAGFPSRTVSTLGGEQNMLYDAEGDLVSISNYGAAITSIERDANGQFIAAVTPGGLRVERTLDPVGRPLTATNPDGTTVSLQYDAAGRVVAQQRSGEGSYTFARDPNGNVTQITAPDGGAVTTSYDANGRVTSRTDAVGSTTQFQYDALGNVLQTTLPGGALVKTEFDSSGRLTAIEDPVGSRVEYSYDVAGQLTATQDPAGGTTSFTYDEIGNLAGAVTPAGNTWGFSHNAKGQRTSQTYPWGGSQSYDLDLYGRITKVADSSGAHASFQYDEGSRLLARSLSSGESETRAYDAAGRLITTTTSSGVTSFDYGVDATLDRVDYPDGSFVEYTYDLAGRTASVRTPGGLTTYGYDSQSRLTSVVDSLLGTTTYSYDLAGRVTQFTLPDGSTTTVGRDARGQVTGIDTVSGGGTLRDSTFAYDPSGKLLSTVEIGRTVDYGYDAAGRITSEVRTGVDAGSVAYAYDPNWSLTQIGARTLTYDGAMRLTSDGSFTSYSYDSAGRPVSRSNAVVSEQFQYDALGRLVRVDRAGASPAVVKLEYDHAGLVNRIESDGVGRRLLWDSAQAVARLVEERTDAGALIRRYAYGLGPVGVFDGSIHVLHRDPNGNVRLITDGAGAVEAHLAFSAYGEPTTGASNATSPLRYASELFIPEVGLYFLRSRFYDPVAGRFLTPDLLQPTGAASQSFNPYQYGNANPIAHRDPLGTFSIGEVQISMSIASILAGLAFQHFVEPLAMVINAFTPSPPSVAYPVGVTAGFGVSMAAPGTGVLGASVGLSATVLTNLSRSVLTVSLNLGATVSLPTPAALANAPQFSVSAGIVFGEMHGPPSVPPSIGYSLDISGTIAEKVMMWYTKSITAGTLGGVPVSVTTLAGGQEFATGSAGLSLNMQPPDGSSVWDAFTISVSPNGVASAPYLNTMVQALEPGWSGFGSSNILPGKAWTLGLSFSVSIPLAYVEWDGQTLSSGVVGLNFDLW